MNIASGACEPKVIRLEFIFGVLVFSLSVLKIISPWA